MRLTLYSIADGLCYISQAILLTLILIAIIEYTLICYIENAIYLAINEEDYQNLKKYVPRFLRKRVKINRKRRIIFTKIYFVSSKIEYVESA